MTKLPVLDKKHKVCVICEGYEDVAYFNRLLELGVWNSAYEFTKIKKKSASNIPALKIIRTPRIILTDDMIS